MCLFLVILFLSKFLVVRGTGANGPRSRADVVVGVKKKKSEV